MDDVLSKLMGLTFDAKRQTRVHLEVESTADDCEICRGILHIEKSDER